MFQQRPPRLLRRRCRDQLVQIPSLAALGRSLHFEQEDRMDLASVLANTPRPEAIVIRGHRLHAGHRCRAIRLGRRGTQTLHRLQVVQRAGGVPGLRRIGPQRDLVLDAGSEGLSTVIQIPVLGLRKAQP